MKLYLTDVNWKSRPTINIMSPPCKRLFTCVETSTPLLACCCVNLPCDNSHIATISAEAKLATRAKCTVWNSKRLGKRAATAIQKSIRRNY